MAASSRVELSVPSFARDTRIRQTLAEFLSIEDSLAERGEFELSGDFIKMSTAI